MRKFTPWVGSVGAFLALVLVVYGASASPYQAVSDAEAAAIVGGTDTCEDVYNYTCGDQDPKPDEECEATNCLANNENGEVAAENQERGTAVVCGDSSCGQVYTSTNCDN